MKVRVKVLNIRCGETTSGIGDDEIYYSILGMSANIQSGPEANLSGMVSSVKNDVTDGTQWVPNAGDQVFEFDIAQSEAFAVKISLYEEDNGDLRESLLESVEAQADGMDWPDTIPTSEGEIITALLALLFNAYKYFRQDDKIMDYDFSHRFDEGNSINGIRQKIFEGQGAKYYVTFEVELI